MTKDPHIFWYRMERKDVLNSLDARPGGLTSEEVGHRLAEYGQNALPLKEGVPAWRVLLNQFASPLVYVLLAAAAISLFVGEITDLIVILVAVVLNTAIGYWQEYKADRAILKLQHLVMQQVNVLRDGREQRVSAGELVPGDILLLEAGDKVSADARILEEHNLSANESSLTGESLPVKKSTETLSGDVSVGDRSNMLFSGTLIASGQARAVVVATGINTEIGQIASLVQQTEEEKTPLQTQLIKVSKTLTLMVLVSAMLVFLVGIYEHTPFTELLITTAALAVAAIPESLLIAMTLVLVVGMKRILQKRGLLRKLVAAETLGSVSIVCSDKTGTITEGKMVVDQLLIGGESHELDHATLSGETIEKPHVLALKAMALCNDAFIKNPQAKLEEWQIEGDQTDAALLVAAAQVGFIKEELGKELGRVDEIPFDETYKFQATLHREADNGSRLFVKGAPERVLSMCTRYYKGGKRVKLSELQRKIIRHEYQELAKQGLRVLALATGHDKRPGIDFTQLVHDLASPRLTELDFIGWVALKDPVRADVPRAFQTMRQAGIRTVIVTGDHRFTVQAIIRELGFDVPDERVMEGKDLESLSDDALARKIRDIDLFARVEPKHKLRIVQAWKKQGEVVAMLGDGVNDAPALKAADIGVAVGASTDVAREVSDLILLDGDFSLIEAAVREGRVMFDNIRKVFLYLVSDSFTEIFLITISLLVGYPVPLAAVQILWINIVSDGLPDLALTLEPAERDVMSFPPRPRSERIVNREIILMIALITAVAVMAALGLFEYYLSATEDIVYARSIVFAMFSIDSIIYVLSIRTLRQPIWRTNLFSNPWLIGAIVLSLVVQVIVVQTPQLGHFLQAVPLHPLDWALIFGVSLSELLVREMVKWLYWHKKEQQVLSYV